MTNEQKNMLLKSQQGELDAVVLYKKLAEKFNDEEIKSKLMEVSADEGKHAAILKKYTGQVLKPKKTKANLVLCLNRLFGSNFIFKLLSNGEMKSIKLYESLVNDFPMIQEIINDEKRHAEIAEGFLDKDDI